MTATFDHKDHALTAGWATYHQKPYLSRLGGLVCRLRGHSYPARTPDPVDGHSPSNYDRCGRCRAFMHWYVEGQHRWGGMNRSTWEAFEFESIAQAAVSADETDQAGGS